MILSATPVQTPPDPTTTYVLMGGACVLVMYFMMRMNARKRKDPLDRPFGASTLAQQRSTERQMENLLVDFAKMSRELSAQLDSRATKLEILIADADERIARLKAANAQAPPRPTFDDPPPVMMRIVPEPEPPVPEQEPPPPIDPKHAAVYRLADEGKTPPEIAATLDRPSGEVELILALRPR